MAGDWSADVAVEDIGGGDGELRERVDGAYRAKYERHGSSSIDAMVSADAVAATLRLTRV
ncbi:DUF2255 family protein [uncultured Jatrophihabitans sp.]|uniref:DUF2255 family protein n=1 Tax=uncultured Jatrophihabitans sp. TaxID=1610747 RepID=UPI0035CAFF33